MFARAPGFTSAAVLTLALGVGANIAIFSLVYGILLRPLPYRDASRLVLVQREQELVGAHQPVPVPFSSAVETGAWLDRARSFESAALYSIEVAARTDEHGTELLDSAVVSGSFFPVMGGPMQAGRPLGPADDLAPSVVISERLWQRLFARSPAAIGQPLVLSSQPYTIVGVAGSEFQFPGERTDVWLPVAFARTQNPRCCGFRMIGRLKPGQTIAAAALEADSLARSLAATAPAGTGAVRATAVGLRDQIAGTVRPALLALFTAAGLTLVVACVNVTNLLLAHRAGRAREMAIRSALGASRARLIAHAAIDSAVLAAAGTVAGVAVAIAVVEAVRHLEPAMIPRVGAVRVDMPVLAFSAGLAAVVAICISLVPGLQSANAADLLRSGATAGTPHGRRVRRLLCVTEVAVSLVLVVGATLLGRSVVHLMQSDLGVTTDRVITASLNLAFERRLPDAEALARVERVMDRVGAVPGIQAIGVGTALPPNASRLRLTLRRTGDTVGYQAAGVAATPGTLARSASGS